MKRYAKAAFVATLLAGAGTMLAVPAVAKKDTAAAKAPALKLSPDVIKSAQTAQTALAAKDTATAEPAIAAIEAAAKTNDDHYIAAALRLQLEAIKLGSAGAADETPLKAPLEALIANPSTPAEKLPTFAFQRGSISFNQKNYPDALTWFAKAKQLGYTDPTFELEIAKAKIDSGDVAGGSAEIDTAMTAMKTAGQTPPEDYYRYIISKTLAAHLYPQTIDWMKRYVAAYPTSKTWRDVIYNYGLQSGSVVKPDKPQLLDLFRLLRQTKSLDQYGYEEYAQKALDTGLPDEAKTVIAEGRAAGKVPATGQGSDITGDANKMIASEGSLTTLETKAKASPSGLLSAQTGDAYLGKADYPKAIALYEQALQKGGVKADEVNTHLGIAKALSGDKAGAKAAFAAVTGAPRADIAGFWSAWVDSPPVVA